ncbi:hypothetical protein [Roseinatronobacter alkalisoli]|uniref:Uncharacterized protein n=1 Tax=Roseinatronobacter alkalisoli TaxID=3028235 RepID=A0ABT5TD42_9RHOB|nr:hypothetical protein [Roseinatronobacter sp. HJB301]MDD7973043.1 hypothetical protein [Roseinatronobacter sp. HJB301]
MSGTTFLRVIAQGRLKRLSGMPRPAACRFRAIRDAPHGPFRAITTKAGRAEHSAARTPRDLPVPVGNSL